MKNYPQELTEAEENLATAQSVIATLKTENAAVTAKDTESQ